MVWEIPTVQLQLQETRADNWLKWLLKFPDDGKEKLYLDKCECKCNNTIVLVNLLPHPEERNCLIMLYSQKGH